MTADHEGFEEPDRVANGADASTAIAKRPDVRLLDVQTGQLVEIDDITTAETDELARVLDETVAGATAALGEIREAVEQELVARLDRRRKWTLRVGDPAAGVQWEISAPSPTAGTTTYDLDELRRSLKNLVHMDEIDEEAAAAALERTLTVTLRLGLFADLDALAEKVRGIGAIAGVPVLGVDAKPAETPRAAGIAAIEKGGDLAASLIADAKHTGAPGRRRPKIKAKRKET